MSSRAHPDYTAHVAEWQRERDVVAGQQAVRDRSTGGTTGYLPKLGGQSDEDYAAYKLRGEFYGATARTIDALVGAIFRRDPLIEASEVLQLHFQNIDLAGTPLDTFAKLLLAEVLTTGRYGVLVDVPAREMDASGVAYDLPPEMARPYWTGYRAEDIVTWWQVKAGGVSRLVRVELAERAEQWNGGDITCVKRRRILYLDEQGIYTVRVEQEVQVGGQIEMVEESTRQPYRAAVGREPLTEIPFVFFGPVNLGPSIQKSPTLDLVEVNLAHWRKACDYAHGLHFTALPTPWIAATAIDKNAVFRIGSQTAWVMGENGKCGMLEFSGAGLEAVRTALNDDEARMAHLGAEMLTPEKKAAESAEALEIRQVARTGSLASISATASWGLSKLAEIHSWWMGESPAQQQATSITLNQKFVHAGIDPQKLAELIKARQARVITERMFLEALERDEELGEQTIDEIIEDLQSESDVEDERREMQAATANANLTAKAMMAQMNGGQPT